MHPSIRNHVTVRGDARGPVLMFAHGFGCDQGMWRHVAPAFERDHRVVLYDNVGAGSSHWPAYDADRHGSLQGYADDAIEICDALGLKDVTFVGHSVSATIGVLAAVKRPDLFSSLVLVCPSPRYTNTDAYVGGFSERDVDELLDLMDINHLDWAATMAPVVMGANNHSEDMQSEWRESVCRTDPVIAKGFARVTFKSDHREAYHEVTAPTLIIECSNDALAPPEVGAYVNGAIAGSELLTLDASGHCPHITEADKLIAGLRHFLERRNAVVAAA